MIEQKIYTLHKKNPEYSETFFSRFVHVDTVCMFGRYRFVIVYKIKDFFILFIFLKRDLLHRQYI